MNLDAGGGSTAFTTSPVHEDSHERGDEAAMMQKGAPWRKRTHEDTTSTRLTTSVRRLTPPSRPTSSTTLGETATEEDVMGAGETHDETYHRLRCSMGVAEGGEQAPRS